METIKIKKIRGKGGMTSHRNRIATAIAQIQASGKDAFDLMSIAKIIGKKIRVSRDCYSALGRNMIAQVEVDNSWTRSEKAFRLPMSPVTLRRRIFELAKEGNWFKYDTRGFAFFNDKVTSELVDEEVILTIRKSALKAKKK